ncbi:MAG TPA: protein-glutamate O-methyltransferase [Syntrophales bacterium]|nr:protein-glutamate O-methyltransferase [Syntrophales bacterium]
MTSIIELKDVDFEKISRFVYDLCGIHLHEGKRELVKARLGKRLREGNFKSFSEYYHYVTTQEGADELITMIDSLSTNLTSFFREAEHFKKLQEIVPVMAATSGKGRVPRLRIWSAGCSTGEEPYSIAMTLKEMFSNSQIDFKIIASDISTRVLNTAVKGIYPEEKVGNVSPVLLKKYFQVGQGDWKGHYRVKKEIQEMVDFMRFNLMEALRYNDPFDVIFCRNVMIYFDKTTQGNIVNKFYGYLKEGGYLFVGRSESLTGLHHQYKYIEPSVYRK